MEPEIVDLTKELLSHRLNLILAKRKRSVLIEELHRQYLEGEVDPKKRMKASMDKLKKSKNAGNNINSTEQTVANPVVEEQEQEELEK